MTARGRRRLAPLVIISLGSLGCLGCQGQQGTLKLELAAAPGSTLLDRVSHLKVTLSAPRQVVEADRGAGGFDLAFDVDATGATGYLEIEGDDAGGQPIAVGASPPFAVAAITARVVVYLAPPLSLAAAPAALTPARSELGVGALTYGAILAGGRDAGGAPSDAVAIYNAYDHGLTAGLPLPAARRGVAVGVGGSGYAYFVGGSDGDGAASATTWRFNTLAAPAGAYTELTSAAGFARTGQAVVPTGGETFVVTGAPVLALSGLDGAITARTDPASLPATAATATTAAGDRATIFSGPEAGATGLVRLRATGVDALASPEGPRTGAGAAVDPSGRALFVGGAIGGAAPLRSALLVDPATGVVAVHPDLLAAGRRGAAVAATARYLLVAGGVDGSGAVSGAAELFDATTLAAVATLPLVVPRTDARAIALSNGQILVVGGVDAAGAPIATLELFTPPLTLTP